MHWKQNVFSTGFNFVFTHLFTRCLGPWHSDSALDRNVDVGEDAYVKKIISSNEGINFNKDIAEAGGEYVPDAMFL